MNHRDCLPWHFPFNVKLAEVVESSPELPAWYNDWLCLSPHSPEEDRLRVYQAVRDSGCLPEEAGLYLVVWQVDALACQAAETELAGIDEQLDEIRRKHGLQDLDPWPGEVPREYQALLNQSYAVCEEIFVRLLEQFGEHGLANRYRSDREEFERRSRAGRRWFRGTETVFAGDVPQWLELLFDEVVLCLGDEPPPGQFGCQYRKQSRHWEVTVYARPVEISGGALDGAVLASGFSVDLDALRSCFERVDAVGWETAGSEPAEEPHVWIRGRYCREEIFLRVLADAPEEAERLLS